MQLQDIPRELRQAIFELVLTAPIPPSGPSESQSGRYQGLHRLQGIRYTWGPRGVWQQAATNKALSLLLVSKQFYVDVEDVIRRLPNNYHVDIMFVKNYGLWPTWDIAKRPTSRYIDKVTSTIRIFEPTDDLDDRFKDSLSFALKSTASRRVLQGALWALYELLVSLIQHGPGYVGLPDNQRFVINEIEVDIVGDGAAYTKLSCRENDNPWWLRVCGVDYGKEPSPEKRLIKYMASHLDDVLKSNAGARSYGQELYEHITKSITFQLNGQEGKKIRIEEYLEECDPSTWSQRYRNRWRLKTWKATQWFRLVRRRRQKVRKDLELNDKQPK